MLLTLEINGQEVDLPEKQAGLIRLNKAAADVQDIDSRTGEHTYSIDLPFTRRNDRVFGSRRNVQVLDKFNHPQGYQAKLKGNGMVIIEGLFRLNSIKGAYQGGIYADTISWVQLLGEKTLQEIESFVPVPYAGVADLQAILAKNCDQTDIQFPLGSYGNFFHPLVGTETVSAKPLNSLAHNLGFEDYVPSVYRLNIIRKIFQDIGWQVTGSVFADQELRKECVAYTGPGYEWNWRYWAKGHVTNDASNNYQVVADPSGRITHTKEDLLETYSYRCITSKTYTIYQRGTFENIFANPVEIQLAVGVYNDAEYTVEAQQYYVEYRQTINPGQIITLERTVEVDVNVGEYIACFTVGVCNELTYKVDLLQEDEQLTIAKNLPDLTQKDFIKAWISENNLMVEADPHTRVIEFIPRQRYGAPADFAIDLSDYADPRHNEYAPATNVQKFKFTYAEDRDDALLAPRQKEYDYEYLNPMPDATSTKEVTTPFAPALLREYVLSDGSKKVQLPTIASQDQLVQPLHEASWSYDYTPRIVKYEGLSPIGYEAEVMGTWIRVGLASVVPTWQERFNQHYRSFLESLVRSHLVTNKFALSPALYNRLKPSLPVKFGQELYELNKISSFDLLDEGELTTIELLRKV